MKNNYWKAFKVGDLFDRYSLSLGIPMKELDISDTRKNKNDVLLISESANNNGFNGYISFDSKFQSKISSDKLTMSDQFARCFYQKGEYTTTTSHLNTISCKIQKLWNLINSEKYLIADYITLLYKDFHNYNRKVCAGNDFNREIILLPVITCDEQSAIWHENDGTPITLDVNTIKRIMDKIEEHKREKTINKYEAEKAKYELEKAKYDNDEKFLEEKKKVYWKSYRVGDIWERSSIGSIKTPLKLLDISDKKDSTYKIPLITMSKKNNGIGGYLEDIGDVTTNKIKNMLTFVQGTDGCSGVCFYQKSEFVSNGISSLKNKKNLNLSDNGYSLFSLYLTALYHNKFHNFARSTATGNDFNREIILLPVYLDENNQEQFSVNTMAYLYLKSMILKQEKKVNDYLQKIKEIKGEDK